MITFASGDTQGVIEKFLYWILSLFAWLAGVMGALMGTVIYETIVKMGVHVHNLSAINLAWGMFRDLGNIFLVFGFIAIGIATILDNASYGAKKALPKLLIVALTLNFSLFVAEFIVDTGNMFATQFYTQISGGRLPTTFSASSEPITSAIFTALKLTTIYDTNKPTASLAIIESNTTGATKGKITSTKTKSTTGATKVKTTASAAGATKGKITSTKTKSTTGAAGATKGKITSTKTKSTTGANANTQPPPTNHWFIIFFLGILLYIITAFVLGSIAILLVTRFVILLFLLIVSPIGFVGLAGIPLLSKYGKQWWQALSDQTLLAPILLLLLLVVTTLAQGGIFNNGNVGYVGAVSGGNVTSIANLLLEFAVIIGLLIASLVISKSLSGKAAGFATKMSGKAVFGGMAKVGRGTLGWGAQRASEGIRNTKLARVPILGRRITGGLDRVATSSFDARAGKLGSGLGSFGISAGTAAKGGYRAEEKVKIDKEVAYGKSLGATKDEKEELESLKMQRASMQMAINENPKEHEGEVTAAEAEHIEKLKEVDDAITAKIKEIEETPTIIGGEHRAQERQEDLEKLQGKRADIESTHSDSMATMQKNFDSKMETQNKNLEDVGAKIKERSGTKNNTNQFAQNQYAQRLGSKNTAAVAGAESGNIIASAALAGAAVGTAALPGVGTAVGAVAAGVTAGALIGKKFGSKWREKASKAIIAEANKSEADITADKISKLLSEQEKDVETETKKETSAEE